MNLHGTVTPLVNVVNPAITVTLRTATGYTTAADGTQAPIYTTTTASAQIQGLTEPDLKLTQEMNIEGVIRKVYLNGAFNGIVRADKKGGDLITMLGHTWKVVAVTEAWPDWTAVIVQQQVTA